MDDVAVLLSFVIFRASKSLVDSLSADTFRPIKILLLLICEKQQEDVLSKQTELKNKIRLVSKSSFIYLKNKLLGLFLVRCFNAISLKEFSTLKEKFHARNNKLL
ncbi:hypothetical protein BpHYR1_007696 [Brachionus plicatilis]|uniref:Uncharacterized protein n=1 Tax=Brachionus plicatilis TaxID=10195 RepID=A0A3M7RPL8_BRAPC|nr:hypothetical protein BpHYR1_007696 [Brachionus plicatilis]